MYRGSGGARRCHEHGGAVNLKAFFVAALQSALDLGLATPDDLLKHVTPDVLSERLPRPLWARLFTACLGAPKVDATLVVETIGVPNLCEHVPAQLIWACLADIGNRSLGRKIDDDQPIVLRPKSITSPLPTPQPVSSGRNRPLTAPPPDVITKPANPPLAPKVGPSIPTPVPGSASTQSLADIVAELEAEGREERATPPPRVRTPTQQRFRQSQPGSGIGRLAQSNPRRPQAAMQPLANPGRTRRGETEAEAEDAETATSDPREGDWRSALAVEEEQLVDWQAADETLTIADDEPRKP